MALLGLDIGSKRVGIALNPYGSIVIELATFEFSHADELLAILDQHINDYQVIGLVVGQPRQSDSPIARLIAAVKNHYHQIKVFEINETLTTKEAERQLRGSGRTDTDTRAAKLILEQFLNDQPKAV